ncbi:MAG: hypothetical protein ABIA47_02095 [bacterium]
MSDTLILDMTRDFDPGHDPRNIHGGLINSKGGRKVDAHLGIRNNEDRQRYTTEAVVTDGNRDSIRVAINSEYDPRTRGYYCWIAKAAE